jgi:hypothetical protein
VGNRVRKGGVLREQQQQDQRLDQHAMQFHGA